MAGVTASELGKKKFNGYTMPEPYGSFMGNIATDASIFIWGPKGSGKTTYCLDFANEFSKAVGNVVFVSGEEGISLTLQQKIKRLDITGKNMIFTEYEGVPAMKKAVKKHKAKALLLDSLYNLEHDKDKFISLQDWAEKNNIVFVVLGHANKDGTYKGNSSIAHMCEVEIKIEDGIARTEKNRYADLDEMKVIFTRKNKNTGTRSNPVKTPFVISLNRINKLHSIRSWKKLNRYVGAKFPCYAKTTKGEKENPHISFRYTPDYNNKKYVLELLLSGRLERSICSTKNFKDAWKKMVKEYGDLEVIIHDQDHAKKVLTMREYRKQERQEKRKRKQLERGKKQKKASKKSTKKKSKSKKTKSSKEQKDSVPKTFDQNHKNFFKKLNSKKTKTILVSNIANREKAKASKLEKARELMYAASKGGSKRDPISLHKRGKGNYVAIDGNTTLTIAKNSGWKTIPATIDKDTSQKTPKPKKKTKKTAKSGRVDLDKAEGMLGGLKELMNDIANG